MEVPRTVDWHPDLDKQNSFRGLRKATTRQHQPRKEQHMSDYKHSLTPSAQLQWVRIGRGNTDPASYAADRMAPAR